MKKSVYSLMLFEEIVEKIDQLADENNTNRSQLINDILAEYLGLMTPEQKIQRILEKLNTNFTDELTISQLNKNSSIHFGKSIKYKYRPKIKYTYEFTGTGEKKYAVLKISSRTKSEELNKLFDQFFSTIEKLENEAHASTCVCSSGTKNHKFIREFKHEGSVSRDINEVTRFLTDYLKMMDQAINSFFAAPDKNSEKQIQEIYRKYLMRKDLQIIETNPPDILRTEIIVTLD